MHLLDNFSVRFKFLAALVSTNIAAYFKLVCAETLTYSVPKHNLWVPKRKKFCAALKAFNCAFKSYFLAPFKKMPPPPLENGLDPPLFGYPVQLMCRTTLLGERSQLLPASFQNLYCRIRGTPVGSKDLCCLSSLRLNLGIELREGFLHLRLVLQQLDVTKA